MSGKVQSRARSYAWLHDILVNGTLKSVAVQTAARLDLGGLLASGDKDVAAIAEARGLDKVSLTALFQALRHIGIIRQEASGCVALTPMGASLNPHMNPNIVGLAKFWGSEFHWAALGSIYKTVTDGISSYEHSLGAPLYCYLNGRPVETNIFETGMSALAIAEDTSIVSEYPFSQQTRVVDVGGGHGNLIAAILAINPRTCGILYDLPSVIRTAATKPGLRQIRSRLQLQAGDMFREIPKRGSCYILKSILMDWNDIRAAEILARVKSAVGPRGVVLVCERLACEEVSLFGLEMLTVGGGYRNNEEFQHLFAAAGFDCARRINTQCGLSIFELRGAR